MIMHRAWRFSLCLWATLLLFPFAARTSAEEAARASAPASARSSGWIAIPEAEYQELRTRAFPAERDPELPPVLSTLTRIDYDLKVNGDFASGQASLTVDVIKDGWVRVPIPSNLLVREAKLDGKLVSLVSDGKGSSSKSVVFTHQGRAMLLLDIVLPVTVTAANESISLPPAIAGITRASFQLPRQGVETKLTGGFLAEKSAASSESKWVAYGRGDEPLVFIWWKKSEDRHNNQPLRMRGSLTEFVGLGEDTTSIQADVNLEIIQGAAKEIKIQVPDKVDINQVAGAMIADWETRPGELAIKFLEPVEKNARLIIAGETRTPREGQIGIPLLRMLNVERETGGVAIEVLGAGEIKDQKLVGYESADPTDLGEIVANRQIPSLIAFRLRSGDSKASRSLSVNVARYQQESVLMANIEEARYKIQASDEGKTLVQARYAIRNNQRNFLKITLPKDAVVWSASLSGNPVRPGKAPDGSLLLPLAKARSGEEAPVFAVEILYFKRGAKWGESGKLKLDLPVLDLPISQTGLVYYYPPLFKVTPEPGLFRMRDYQDPVSAALNTNYKPAVANAPPQINANMNRTIDQANPQSFPIPTNNAVDIIGMLGGSMQNPAEMEKSLKAKKEAQALVDQYRTKSQEGKRAGILPLSLSFPDFGPSIFLVSELTGENLSRTVEIRYEEDKKGGAK
jgi:hypothetical protein